MKRKSWFRLLRYLLALITLVMLLVIFAVEPFVKYKIEEAINSGQVTHVKIGHLSIHFFTSKLDFSDIEIFQPTENRDADKSESHISGTIKEINIIGINFYNSIFKKEIEINELQINNTFISCNYLSKNETLPDTIIHSILSPIKITVHKISIDNSTLISDDFTGTKNFREFKTVIPSIQINVKEINKNDTLSSNLIKTLDFRISSITSLSQDSLYELKIVNLTGNNSGFLIDSFISLPLYDNEEFMRRSKFETDRIHLVITKVSLESNHQEDLFHNVKKHIASVKINNSDINVYRDKRLRDSGVKKALIQELLMKIEPIFMIDSLELKEGKVKYTEHDEEANSPGVLWFTNLHAQFTHITNDSNAITDSIKMHAQGLLMNKGKIDINMVFPVNDPTNKFTCRGSVGSMDLDDLNPMLEKNAYIYAKGKLKSLRFNMTADNVKSYGSTTILYSDLRVTTKSSNTDDTTSIKEKVVSFIANQIIIAPSNPIRGKDIRVGKIEYERNPHSFIFNYFWKSLLTGIKSTVLSPGKSNNSKKKK